MTRRKNSGDRFEQVIRVISIAAIGAIVASLIWSGMRASSGAPDLRARTVRADERSDGVAFEVHVRNVGGETGGERRGRRDGGR